MNKPDESKVSKDFYTLIGLKSLSLVKVMMPGTISIMSLDILCINKNLKHDNPTQSISRFIG